MASIHKEVEIDVPVELVWDAVRDIGAVHTRLVPNVLKDARLETDSRVVTFANGFVVRELIVALDEDRRRFAYAAVGGRTSHHNASIQVFSEGPSKSRLIWITDFLPDTMAGPIAALIEQGALDMKITLEKSNR
ncbi:MAG TPA: SRPBCC family protein [Burkholderiaceae bacterium]|nr:SRPBCC family protein [Burkholderiaceae bacterium]